MINLLVLSPPSVVHGARCHREVSGHVVLSDAQASPRRTIVAGVVEVAVLDRPDALSLTMISLRT